MLSDFYLHDIEFLGSTGKENKRKEGLREKEKRRQKRIVEPKRQTVCATACLVGTFGHANDSRKRRLHSVCRARILRCSSDVCRHRASFFHRVTRRWIDLCEYLFFFWKRTSARHREREGGREKRETQSVRIRSESALSIGCKMHMVTCFGQWQVFGQIGRDLCLYKSASSTRTSIS